MGGDWIAPFFCGVTGIGGNVPVSRFEGMTAVPRAGVTWLHPAPTGNLFDKDQTIGVWQGIA